MFFKTNVLFASYLSSFAFAAVHEVDVGNGGLTFDPENVQVAQGDIIIFRLYPNHDVVQGNFDSPCTPSDSGFYSGPFSETDNGDRRFVVNVTSDEPHYWYCSVQRHCQQGMVGGANVPSDGDTIEAYKEAAADVQQAETPSQRTGGSLVEEDDLDEITSTAGSPSATESASPSGSDAPTTTSGGEETSNTDAAETASSSAAADTIVASGGATGILGLVIGLAGFFM